MEVFENDNNTWNHLIMCWGMLSTPLLPLLPGPLWPEMVAPDRALSIG